MELNDEAKRKSTVLAIAQFKFKQALKKEESEARLPPVSNEASSQFFSDLDAVLMQNTRKSVQTCTEWIVKHITPSKARPSALGLYLVSVSKSIVVNHQPAAAAAAAASAAAKKALRNRFDLLLIVNDVLHVDKFHRHSNTTQSAFSKASAPFISELVELAASCVVDSSTPGVQLRAIINYWAVNELINVEDLQCIRDMADEAMLVAQGGTPIRKRDYLLPEYHGDNGVKWHNLPASYMLEQLIKDDDAKIDGSRIKIAKFDNKPVSPHVRKLLDNYFENIDLKYQPTGDNPTGGTNKYKLWLDPIGQLIKQDKKTGETAMVCNGYGWSKKFCEDMRLHRFPENITKAREDVKRMEKVEEVRELPQKRRYSRSPRRHRRSSSGERGRHGRSRSYSPSRRSSGSSPGSRSRDRSYHRRHRSPMDKRRGSDDRGQKYDNAGSGLPRQPSRPYGRDSFQSGSRWNGSNGPNRVAQVGSALNHHPTPLQPPQSFDRGFSQPPQPTFSAPPFPPQPPPLGQFPGPFPLGQFPPHPPPIPPPQFQGLGGFPANLVPPPPPPNFSGAYQPQPPHMTAMPNNPYNIGNQYGNQQGNNFGYGNGGGYGHNPGGFPGTRGGYRGSAQGGGYNTNRGGYGGSQRGQRGRGARY